MKSYIERWSKNFLNSGDDEVSFYLETVEKLEQLNRNVATALKELGFAPLLAMRPIKQREEIIAEST